MNECVYRERDRDCHEPGAYEIQFSGRKNWLCERHVRPEFHPPDLRKRLPGRIQRAIKGLR